MSHSKPARQAGIPFILVTIFLDVLTFGLVIPVVPSLVRHFSADDAHAAWWMGMMVASFSIMQFAFAPVLGALSDRFGRRPVILASVAGAAIDQLFMAFAPGLGWLLGARLVAGLTAANITAANAYIADISTAENRAKNFGLVGAAFGLGFIAGPALGGLLGEIHLRLPFMVAAGLAGVNFLYGLFVLPESLAPANRRPFSWRRANPVGSLTALAKHPAVLGLAASRTCSVLAMGVLQTIWVLYTTKLFKWGELENGLSLAALGLATAVVQGALISRIVRRLGETRTALLGLTIEALAYLGYGMAGSGALFVGAILIHALAGISSPAIQSVVTRSVGANEQGSVQGAFASVQSLTFIFAPLIGAELFGLFTAGESAHSLKAGIPFLFGAGCLLLAGLIAIWALRRAAPSPIIASTGETA
ncbi:TCR/Tet family MFS transporter [Niveispirillum sp. BGYR6]|uniref:TCR/Tet family MFS transporter n=1 Tax=Niveispirillum sp. BGYR6 TaxID=2971249 RepID=UPI0022B96240|nr:TCR/Tet family MFS transporter [Niveispirillum sp. BGYR6]MDG5497640.1 TCR/Tet family MFS transporter [Niveispirillum sp. BGYR6]